MKLYEGSTCEVKHYQHFQETTDLKLSHAGHPTYLADHERSPQLLTLDVMGHSAYFQHHAPSHYVYAFEELAEDATAPDGTPIMAHANRWVHPNGGYPVMEFAYRGEASPLIVLHELAHAIDIEADHGEEWLAHFEALVAERYAQDASQCESTRGSGQ